MSVQPCLPLYLGMGDAVTAASAALRQAAQAATSFGFTAGLLSREAVAYLEGSFQEAIYSVDVAIAVLGDLARCYDENGHPGSAEKMRTMMRALQHERAGLAAIRDRILPLVR